MPAQTLAGGVAMGLPVPASAEPMPVPPAFPRFLLNLLPASSSGRPGLVAADPPEPVPGGLPQRLRARLLGGFLRARGFPGDVAVGGSVARMQLMANAEFWYLLGNLRLLVCEEL